MPVAALIAIALFVVCEALTRAFFHPGVVSRATWEKLYPAYDSAFSKIPVCYPEGDQVVCGATPYLNITPVAFPRHKPAGEYRIFVIGASVARGGKRSYSHMVQTGLRKTHPNVRVINLAASAIGAERQRLRYEEALAYAPDLLILHVHGSNEARDERERGYSKRLHQGLGGLVLHSRFVVMSKKLLAETFGLQGVTQTARQTRRSEQIAMRGIGKEALLRETLHQHTLAMLKDAEQRGLPVILMGRTQQDLSTPEETEINQFFRAAAATHHATFFDLDKLINKLSPSAREQHFKDKSHLTRRGHRLIARKLIPVVREHLPADVTPSAVD